MERGCVPITKDFELEYRYYDRDPVYKYFNRKFEVIVLEKKTLKKQYVMHMDNANTKQMMPRVYKASSGNKKLDFGISTLNWNDIKMKFTDYVVAELGERKREQVKRAISKLSSPKL